VTPDGLLCSGSYDHTIRIWDLNKNKGEELLDTLTGHTKPVSSLTVTPDGLLCSGSWDKTIRIWNLKTGECIKILDNKDAIGSLVLI